jgi:hypothetical protein
MRRQSAIPRALFRGPAQLRPSFSIFTIRAGIRRCPFGSVDPGIATRQNPCVSSIIGGSKIRRLFSRSRSIRGQTKLALHPLDDRGQCQAGLIPISFSKPHTFYSPIGVELHLWRLALNDDANETCTLRVSRLDGFSDRRLQTLARD